MPSKRSGPVSGPDAGGLRVSGLRSGMTCGSFSGVMPVITAEAQTVQRSRLLQ
ncbi:MAG: hypothetical protein ACREOO_15665 [bacterium]